ncbi:MAG: A/G-specific adenine glycosylase [Chitinophagaceae bacterium]|nr:A/G-specific adenine glycosylase [Chitinophagaceae bacterium]
MKAEFTRKLMRWNRDSNKRSMPWKGEKDPYKIWLSEIILQQTRVEQGLKYYEKFISKFPTIEHLAVSPDEKVYKLWEGLGYYSRCKNLLETARRVKNEYSGTFPDNYEEIKKLKGIGPYTAAAISSFAYNEPRAVVDGNVQRVLARYFGLTTPIDTNQGKNFYQQLAFELLDKKNAALYNQSIMDFGATICKPQNPLCKECIQQRDCVAFNKGFVARLPVKEKMVPKKNRWLYYFLIEVDDQIYIRKRAEKDIWQNLHEFVLLETPGPINRPFQGLPFLKKLFQRGVYDINHTSKLYKQQLTHQTIQGQFILVIAKKELVTLYSYMLVKKDKLHQYAFPKFINKFLEERTGFPA